ncbi:unnamed protein product [Parnassius apollo]|uniref:(apollo) hypothetical protein n=1 Tax=Parnassius apollo TaxID=110799 RepID=A0A8S3X3U7_PARAO|nr:unnamed protein product [Parnassius apollo]
MSCSTAPHESCNVNFTILTGKVTDIADQLKSLRLSVKELTKCSKAQTLAQTEQKSQEDPRIGAIMKNLQETKDILLTLQQTPPPSKQISYATREVNETVMRPIVHMIQKLLLEINELKESNTAQTVIQGNLGLGAELAIADIKEKVDELRRDYDEIHSKTEKTNDVNTTSSQTMINKPLPHKLTYAEVTGTPRYTMILESIDPRSTSDEIMKQVRKDIDPVDLGVRVNKITKLRNQRVVINCDSHRDQQILKTAIRDTCSKITISTPSVKHPQLRLIGVTNDHSARKQSPFTRQCLGPHGHNGD